jgi:hypothetical protein
MLASRLRLLSMGVNSPVSYLPLRGNDGFQGSSAINTRKLPADTGLTR